MDWKDIAGVVGKAAPILGTLVGGPGGAAIGGIIASALGTGGTPEDIEKALTSNPDALVKLRELETTKAIRFGELAEQQAESMMKADTARIEADALDRKSAREREVNAHDSWTPRILAGAITAGFFGVLAFILINGVPKNGGDVLMVMLGSLGTSWAGVVGYYFGSSASSATKTAIMAGKGV